MNQNLAAGPSTSTLAAARVRRWEKLMRHHGEEVLIERGLLLELEDYCEMAKEMCAQLAVFVGRCMSKCRRGTCEREGIQREEWGAWGGVVVAVG